MRSTKRFLAMLLCLVLIVAMLPTALAAETPAQTTGSTDAEWTEVQSIISRYYGEWKDTTYSGAVNSRIPNTALLGNGDVGVSSAGNNEVKQFYISKGDFWEYNGNPANGGYGSPMLIGTYSIGENTEVDAEDKGKNLAPTYKNITYSSQYDKPSTGDYFPAADAVDGVIHESSTGDGWVSEVPFNGQQWFAPEFEEAITFQRYIVYNDGYVRPSEAKNNTKDFQIQVSNDGETWETVSTVTGNTDSMVDISLDKPVTAKYVKMLITAPGGAGDRARVVEFELYKAPAADVNLAPANTEVTCSSEYNDVNGTKQVFAAADAVDGTILGTGAAEGWCTDAKPSGTQHWLRLKYADPITFQRYVLYNDGYARPSEAKNNTKDFQIQVSNDGATWTTVDTVTGNTANVVDVNLKEPVTASYVQILITSPGGAGDRARVVEFELYKTPLVEEEVEDTNPNLAVGATVYACGAYTDGGKTWSPAYLVDGVIEAGTKWCCVPSAQHPGDITHWAILDLGEAKTFGYYKMSNAGVNNEANHNTRDYELQYLATTDELSEEELEARTDWITLDSRTGNTQTYTSASFDPVTARYVRLYITKPDNANGAARVHELELYAYDPTPYFYEKEDILNAEVDTDMEIGGQVVSMQTYMAATENVMVTALSGVKEAVDLKLDLTPSAANVSLRPVTAAANDDGSITVTRTTALTDANMPASDLVQSTPYKSQAAVSTKVVGAESKASVNGNTARLTFTLEPGKTVYLVTAICGGGQTYDQNGNLWEGRTAPVAEAAALLATVKTEADLNKLHNDHLNWWKEYWLQSYISLDTSNADLDVIQKYYYAAQYLLGSGIREGNIGAGIYGIWHTNDSPSWHSDYHLNYNFIATYYGLASSNRVSMLLPAAEALTDYIPQGKANAASVSQLRAVYSSFVDELIELGQVDPVNGIADAILFPVSIGPYAMTLENNSYHHETVNAPYSIYPLIEYYNYTLDEDFLENSLYPYLELVNNFAAHWLVKNEDGSYTLYAGYNEGSWAKNPAVELSAYKNCLRYGVKFSKMLGDDNWKTWEPIYEGLADQPTVENYNGSGKTVLALAEQEWNGSAWVDMATPVPGDGNCIPLDALLPGEVFGYYSSNETLQILQDTVKIFDERGGWTQINNFPRLATDAVNCRYSAERIVEQLAAGIRRQMKANMMIDDGVHGIEKAGSTETVNNMLLLSDQGVIKLFGNWLEDTDAKFVRLRAPGAFVFSAEYDGDTKEVVEGVTMYSEAGATATIASLWDEGTAVFDSKGNLVPTTVGTAPNHEEEITYTFDTVKGETYTLKKAVAVTGVTLDKETAVLNVGETATLTATVAPSDATNKAVVWTSSDEAVATVDENGVVTAVGVGEAVITATTADGEKTATCAVTVQERPVEVVVGEPEVKAPEDLSEEEQAVVDEVKEALETIGTVSSDDLDAAAKTVADNNTVTEEQGKAALEQENVTVAEDATVTIVVQPYMDIEIKDVTLDESGNTLTVEITPMYKTIATTANVAEGETIYLEDEGTNTKNAVEIGSAKEMEITEPVEMTIPLPAGFTDGTTLYVRHIKDGCTYVYTGTVVDGMLVFTNPHGFSKFVITAEAPAVKIGEVGYLSLQDAVDAVKDGETIVLNANNLSATVSREVTFTVVSNGNKFTLSAGSGYQMSQTGNTYTFTQKSSGGFPIIILPGTGSSVEKPTEPMDFTDVSKGDLYYDDILYVYENGIMNGTGSGKFSPNATLTRAMVVTILYRMEGEPATRYNGMFSDVANYQWYTDGVEWAAKEGIVTGYTNGKFGPNDPVTREQLAAILYRYAQSKNYVLADGANLAAYADASNISSYAVAAVKWSVAEDLLDDASGKLLPRENATRAEVAHAIAGFCRNVGK